MSKDDINSAFDYDSDPEFEKKFRRNIDLALGDVPIEEPDRNEMDLSAKSTGEKPIPERNSLEAGNKARIPEMENEKDIKLTQENYEIEASVFLEGQKSTEEAVEVDIEDELHDINVSLARKICEEMDHIGAEKVKNQKKNKMFGIQRGLLLSMLCLIGFAFFAGFTKPGNQLLLQMRLNLTGSIWSTYTGSFKNAEDVVEDLDYIDVEDEKSSSKEIDPTSITWPDHPGEGRKEEGVYNILMLGEEAIGNGTSRGRTDVIVIATMNTKTKELKLTSLLRDTLVQIPGYKDNKLNTAYEKGGLDLLYETIALNFDIRLDGCVMVNFENFEKIIDKLGGLEITLTAGEAKYLNTTNYISKREYRNVVNGTQLLNGNQVLGYSRVRKRATITGNNNDYGRTDRHRIILNAIFDKYKSKSKVELASIMFELLPMISTDIDNQCFQLLLNNFIEMGTTDLSQLRIPEDGAFEDNVKVRGMDVLIPDLQKNVKSLHTFIFGDNDALATSGIEGDAAKATDTTLSGN